MGGRVAKWTLHRTRRAAGWQARESSRSRSELTSLLMGDSCTMVCVNDTQCCSRSLSAPASLPRSPPAEKLAQVGGRRPRERAHTPHTYTHTTHTHHHHTHHTHHTHTTTFCLGQLREPAASTPTSARRTRHHFSTRSGCAAASVCTTLARIWRLLGSRLASRSSSAAYVRVRLSLALDPPARPRIDLEGTLSLLSLFNKMCDA